MNDIKKEVAEGFEQASCTASVNGSNSVDAVADHVFGIQGVVKQQEHMEATATAFTEYVAKFIARRFPEGLPPAMTEIVSEIILDAFEDGAAWADREAMRQDIMVAPKQVILP